MVVTRSQTRAAREAATLKSHSMIERPALSKVPTVSIPDDKAPPNEPKMCWVDASSTRIAILVGQSYITFSLKKGWQTKKRDINWAETIAFELLAHVLISRGQVGVVKVHSDSHTALRAVGGSKVQVREIIESTQRLNALVGGSGLMLKGTKVATKGNLADPFTRGKKVNGYNRMSDVIVIPEALAPFVVVE